MGLLSLNLPVIGQSSATEDQKVRDALAAIQTDYNGNLTDANISATAGIQVPSLLGAHAIVSQFGTYQVINAPGGAWHVYANGRRVFVKASAAPAPAPGPAAAGGRRLPAGPRHLRPRRPVLRRAGAAAVPEEPAARELRHGAHPRHDAAQRGARQMRAQQPLDEGKAQVGASKAGPVLLDGARQPARVDREDVRATPVAGADAVRAGRAGKSRRTGGARAGLHPRRRRRSGPRRGPADRPGHLGRRRGGVGRGDTGRADDGRGVRAPVAAPKIKLPTAAPRVVRSVRQPTTRARRPRRR
jgi:hypothetical protein